MPKNDNAKAATLYESVKANAGTAEADKLAQTLPLSASADFRRKFKWAKEVCTYLESSFAPDKLRDIRMGCSCHPSPKYISDVKKLFQSSADLDEFCGRYNTAYKGEHSISHEGDTLYFSYPTCYCSCVKRVDETLPETWCLCSLGYVKKLFDRVFDCDVNVTLIESVKTGADKCVIRIER